MAREILTPNATPPRALRVRYGLRDGQILVAEVSLGHRRNQTDVDEPNV